MFTRLAETTLRHRRWFAALMAVVVLAFASGLTKLQPDFSLVSFFGGEDPARIAFDQYTEYWGSDDLAAIVVVSCDEGDVLTAGRMDILQRLAEALSAGDDVLSVTHIGNANWVRGGSGWLEIDRLSDTMPDDARSAEFAEWRQAVLDDEAFVPGLLSETGQVAAMFIEFAGDTQDIQQVVPLVDALRGHLAEAEGQQGLHFAAAGIPVVRTDFFDVFYEDQKVFLPLMAVLVALVLAIFLRRVHGILVPGIAAIVPVVMVMGLMGHTGSPLDIVSQTLLTLLPAIALADAVHLVSRFHEEARAEAPPGKRLTPEARSAAIARALGAIGGACLLTTFTTAIGFGSLMLAGMPILRSFGMHAAIGVGLAYGSVLLLIPLLLSLTRGSPPHRPGADAMGLMDRFLVWSGRISTSRPRAVLLGAAVVTGLFLFLGSRVVVDNNLTKLLYDDHPTTVANHLADRELGGIIALELDIIGDSVVGESSGAVVKPEVLRALLTLEEELEQWDEVRLAASPATMVAGVMQRLTGSRAIPDTEAGVAQALLMLESMAELEEVLSFDRNRGRMVVRLRDEGAMAFQGFSDRLAERVDALFGGLPVEIHPTGTVAVAYRGINNVAFDLRNSLTFAFVLISIAILALFRNPRMVVVALVPTVMPLILGYGLLDLLGWFLDPTTGMVFTVTLGIAIDDSIHVLARYREERRRGLDVTAAAQQSVFHSGRAVAITSVLVGIGIGINVLSSFPAVVVLGWLGAFMMLAALLCDVIVLPALLVVVEQH